MQSTTILQLDKTLNM